VERRAAREHEPAGRGQREQALREHKPDRGTHSSLPPDRCICRSFACMVVIRKAGTKIYIDNISEKFDLISRCGFYGRGSQALLGVFRARIICYSRQNTSSYKKARFGQHDSGEKIC
jgi:hypothetical protein